MRYSCKQLTVITCYFLEKKMRQLTIALFLIFSIQFHIEAKTVKDMEKKEDIEFKKKFDLLKKRYQDFYIRQNNKERIETIRLKDSDKQRKARNLIKTQRDLRRREFIKNRKVKIQLNAEKWEKELEQQKKERRLTREIYVKKRNRFKRQLQEVRKVPENEDVGL